MNTMQPGYVLQTQDKIRTRLDIPGITMYYNFQAWLDL